MGFLDFFKTWGKKQDKVFNPNWHTVGGAWGPHTYDAFHSKPEPTKQELLQAFQDTVYSCATLIANKIATTPVKLYVRTDKNQAKPKCLTRPVEYKTAALIRQQKAYSPDAQIDEVTTHPVLDVLRRVNFFHNYFELIGLTQLYLELCGNAYWLVKPDSFGIPTEVYPIPAHTIAPVRDNDGFIVGWTVGTGIDQKHYGLEQIIHFKFPNPLDPYGEGTSPVRAAWQRVQISWKELGYLDSTLSNNARPDTVLAPKDPISPIEAERLAKEWGHRFRGQGNGGVIVTDQSLTVTPLNFPPRDLAELQLYSIVKTSVCNSFGIPPDLFEMGESNRATAEAALFSLAEHAIKPRMLHLLGKLNERFLPLFDQGQGRLFLESEKIVPDDKNYDLQRDTFLLNAGAITRNELRDKYGYPPAEWAAEPLLPPGMMPATSFSPQDAPENVQDTPESTEPGQDRATYGPAIATLQTAVYGGQLPREAAIAQARILYGLTPDEAGELFPLAAPVDMTQQAGPELPGDQDANPFPKSLKCGGEGGKPGPCPEGGADAPTGSSNEGPTSQSHAEASAAVDELGKQIASDPKAQQTAKSAYRKVADKLKQITFEEFPAWAVEHADVWLKEEVMNSMQSGSVLTMKAAAWGAAKAYLGIRKLLGKATNTGDVIAKLHNLMEIVGKEGGFNVPTVDELRAKLQGGEDGNNLGSDQDDSRGGPATRSVVRMGKRRRQPGLKCGGEGGKPGPCPENKPDAPGKETERPKGDAESAGYVDDFNRDPSTISLDEVESGNRELEQAGSDYRIVPSEDGQGFEAMHLDDLEDQFGDNWQVDRDPETGKLIVADSDFFGDRQNELAEQPDDWANALNSRPVTPEDVSAVEESVNSNQDSDAALVPGEDGKWVVTSKDDVADQYGDDWHITQQGGKWVVAGKSLKKKSIARPRMKPSLPLADKLKKFFRRQAGAVLERLKTAPELVTKAAPLEGWFDIDSWTRDMAREMRPTVALYWDFGARDTVSRIGASLDLLKVVQPQLARGLDKATFLFCQDTNETTSQELGAAVQQLKQSLAEGMNAAEAQNQLTQRVQEIFESADTSRAYRIAVTEASRAQHAAQTITAKESGIVKGKRWILSDDACPICLPLANKVVGLDEVFTTLPGGGPYSDVHYPPLHPHCRCDMIEVVEGVNEVT